MDKYIINSFFYKKTNTINDIFQYIKIKYDNNIELNAIKNKLSLYLKHKVVFIDENNNYHLFEEGNKILDQQIRYSIRTIINIFKKYNRRIKLDKKKYSLKEVREEQQSLRNYLINNKEQICIICDKKLPLCLLETAHLKPRYLLNNNEKNDNNVVEFMCRFCHKLYDDGYLGISSLGLLCVSSDIIKNNYNLEYNENKPIIYYNTKNNKYFDYHYRNIYRCKL
jgi:hypothetical protein